MDNKILVAVDVQETKTCSLCQTEMFKEFSGIVLCSYPPQYPIQFTESDIEVRTKLVTKEEFAKL